MIRRRPIPRVAANKGKRTSKRRKSRKASKAQCDKLWSLLIRRTGTCKLAGRDHVRCGGVLQAAHCFGRGHHSVRHELWNGWPLCAGHHVWYTHHPEAWTAQLIEAWGQEVYQARYEAARTVGKPDYAKILLELRGAA